MVIIRIKGGLGNQLFQYAAAYSLAQRLGQEVAIDSSFFPQQSLRGFKLDLLNIEKHNIISKENSLLKMYKNRYINKFLRQINCRFFPCGQNMKYLLETRSDLVPEFFTLHNKDLNVYMDGYYQSEAYFQKHRKELISQFLPIYPMEEEYRKILLEIQKHEAVAVHVRRGDFLKAQNDHNPNHYLLGEAYYHNALRYISEKLQSLIFYWFSDDIEWVKNSFGNHNNFRFISLHTKHPDIDEMMLMKNCKHIIAANSTFSWWASWLNEQENAMHICPAKRYGNLHMIPENWIKIAVE